MSKLDTILEDNLNEIIGDLRYTLDNIRGEDWYEQKDNAYEEVKYQLNRLIFDHKKELLKSLLESELIKPEYHNLVVGKYKELELEEGIL